MLAEKDISFVECNLSFQICGVTFQKKKTTLDVCAPQYSSELSSSAPPVAWHEFSAPDGP
jgi:hypothetical protein